MQSFNDFYIEEFLIAGKSRLCLQKSLSNTQNESIVFHDSSLRMSRHFSSCKKKKKKKSRWKTGAEEKANNSFIWTAIRADISAQIISPSVCVCVSGVLQPFWRA